VERERLVEAREHAGLETEGQRGRGNARSAEPYRSPAERRAEGRRLRDVVPRTTHSGWTPPQERRDPVELILAANEDRLLDLVPIRHGRMLQSPFAFYRGSAALMAADLAHTPHSGLRVQACGDAHLMNFGGFATPERNVICSVALALYLLPFAGIAFLSLRFAGRMQTHSHPQKTNMHHARTIHRQCLDGCPSYDRFAKGASAIVTPAEMLVPTLPSRVKQPYAPACLRVPRRDVRTLRIVTHWACVAQVI
jgi:hypothetical protein